VGLIDKLKNRGREIDAAVEKSVKGKAAPKPKPKAKAAPKQEVIAETRAKTKAINTPWPYQRPNQRKMTENLTARNDPLVRHQVRAKKASDSEARVRNEPTSMRRGQMALNHEAAAAKKKVQGYSCGGKVKKPKKMK
jgi:hypothetical protein